MGHVECKACQSIEFKVLMQLRADISSACVRHFSIHHTSHSIVSHYTSHSTASHRDIRSNQHIVALRQLKVDVKAAPMI